MFAINKNTGKIIVDAIFKTHMYVGPDSFRVVEDTQAVAFTFTPNGGDFNLLGFLDCDSNVCSPEEIGLVETSAEIPDEESRWAADNGQGFDIGTRHDDPMTDSFDVTHINQ